jgi:hypothetical protein
VNRAHHWYCAREAWKRHLREELVPPALAGVAPGDHVRWLGFDDVAVTAGRDSFSFRARRPAAAAAA